MAQLIIAVVAGLACLSLAAAAGVLVFSDRSFNARLSARLDPKAQPASGHDLAASLAPRAVQLLTRWGQAAGKGAIENERRAALRLQLIQAGFASKHAPEAFFGLQVAACVALAVIGIVVSLVLRLHGALGLLGPVILGANLGYIGPKVLLARRIRQRVDAVRLGLPDAIDLMVVSVEAGATLTAAIQRLVVEFRDLHRVLAEQFGVMLTEIQAGASRAEALTRLAQRCPAEELTSFSTMLIQSEAVGASLGSALRIFAEEVRTSRFLEAERKAAELPVKLAFPLVLCIFPCLVAVIFIPVGIQMLRHLLNS